MTAVIEQIVPHHPSARALVGAMTLELAELCPSSAEPAADPEQVEGGVMMVAWMDGKTVACGVLRPFEAGGGEIKRLHVTPSCRRRGFCAKDADGARRSCAEDGFRHDPAGDRRPPARRDRALSG